MFSKPPTFWPGFTGSVNTASHIALNGYAELRLVPNPTNNEIRWVLYGETPGDGQEGRFYFDANSTRPHSPPLVVRPESIASNVPGRFIRMQ